MLRGLYSAASAMEVTSRNQEIVAENLAHAVTPGYRRQGHIFEVVNQGINDNTPPRDLSDPRTFSHFESGPMQQTGNPFDLAIVGNGFFVLDGPNGPVYTRNGAFGLSPTGALVSHGGQFRVSGVNLPPTASRISIGVDGTVTADGANVGQVQVATFARPEALRRVGTTLFQGDGPQSPPPGTVRVEQGFREGSNVQPVQEMVAMMLGLRHYEAAEKAMRALSDAIAQNTRMQQ